MARSLGAYSPPLICKATAASHRHVHDVAYMRRAVDIADKSAGFTSPHPNFGCVVVTPRRDFAGEGYLYAQGTKPAEIQAVEAGGEHCGGATAYLNMEPGDCLGDHTAISALVQIVEEAQKSCLLVNLPLIHRAISRVPFSVLILKYAITLGGKIAASSGYAAWISSKLYRNRVFELRGRSNASIVGGNTVCRDNPRLTARHGRYSD
ncbi:hypothetical protein SLA2020_252040 [Shorea laevis]